jgi:hypothetical protein
VASSRQAPVTAGHRALDARGREAAVQALEVVAVRPQRRALRPVEVHAGVLQRVVLVEQLRADGADVRQAVVRLDERREPARAVRQHVGVQQQQQAPAGGARPDVVGVGEAEVAPQQHEPERHVVHPRQALGQPHRLLGQLRASRGRRRGRPRASRVGDERGELVLEEVDALVERDEHRHVGGRGRRAVGVDRRDLLRAGPVRHQPRQGRLGVVGQERRVGSGVVRQVVEDRRPGRERVREHRRHGRLDGVTGGVAQLDAPALAEPARRRQREGREEAGAGLPGSRCGLAVEGVDVRAGVAAEPRQHVGRRTLRRDHDQADGLGLGVAQPAADVVGALVERVQLVDEQPSGLRRLDLHARQRLAQRLVDGVQLLGDLAAVRAAARRRRDAGEEGRGDLAALDVDAAEPLPGQGPHVADDGVELLGREEQADPPEPDDDRLRRPVGADGGQEAGALGTQRPARQGDGVRVRQGQVPRVVADGAHGVPARGQIGLLPVPADEHQLVPDAAGVLHLADDDALRRQRPDRRRVRGSGRGERQGLQPDRGRSRQRRGRGGLEREVQLSGRHGRAPGRGGGRAGTSWSRQEASRRAGRPGRGARPARPGRAPPAR